MNRLFIFCLMLIAIASKAQSTARSIVYEVLENGKVLPNRSIRLKCSAEVALISNPNAVEQLSIDYIGRKTIKSNTLMNQKYTVFTKFEELPKPQVTALKDTILGYPCQKVTYDLFSNRLEVWYTTAAMVKGSPSISFVPENGLVLKYVVNENRTIRAVSTALIDEQLVLPTDLGEVVLEAKYAALQIKSRYTVIPVFSNQQINYELSIQNPAPNRLDTTYRYSKGNIILKKIKLPKNSSKGSLFVSLTERSNGDAYDRVGSVFTFRPSDNLTILDAFEKGIQVLPAVVDNGGQRYQGIVPSGQYQPVVELMRFFTPFGVGHFNNKRIIDGYQWAETASYKQEITALVPSDQDEMWIGVYIGNYDKGGHRVSLELDFYPDPEATDAKKWIKPIFNTVNILEAEEQQYGRIFQKDTLETECFIPDSLERLQLLFTTTGHGGWGQGDEFVPKRNQLFIDNQLVFEHTPWRTDCGAYRLSNPASGNFPDGLSSSDLSRSNWCPGTSTPPFVIPLPRLAKGKHKVKLVIDQGPDEGTSFSHWSVSGVLIGNLK